MNFWETLYTVANNAGIPTTKIGPKLGLSREYVATCKSKRIDTSISNAIRLLGACDYVLVTVPKTEQLPNDAIVINYTDNE